MTPPVGPGVITCREVQDESLDALYLSDRLTEAETLAFEQHCFRCAICWNLVSCGANIRAASLGDRTDIPARTAVARSRGLPPRPGSSR